MIDKNIVLLASRNAGKIREFANLLAPFAVTVRGAASFPQLEEVEENGASFEENALLKAAYSSKTTGLVAIADDSGIEVEALAGKPGIYSARFSAEPGVEATDARNNAKLLKLMQDLPQSGRAARFVSVVVAMAPCGQRILARGEWEGFVTCAPRGENGFGYDPLFLDPQTGLTAAEMDQSEKNKRSHRAQAARKLLELWPDFWTNI